MKYTLIKNGYIVNNIDIVRGDILVGNGRVIETRQNMIPQSSNTTVVDANGKYLLPGLLHFGCPFIKKGVEGFSRANFQSALANGATFVVDAVKLKSGINPYLQIEKVKGGGFPAMADYGLHLDIGNAPWQSDVNLTQCYLSKGISSVYVKWKHVYQLLTGALDNLIIQAAKLDLLLIVGPRPTMEMSEGFNKTGCGKDFALLQEVISYTKNFGIKLLILNIEYLSEAKKILALQNSEQVIVAVSPTNRCMNAKQKFSANALLQLHRNPNVILSPPLISTNAGSTYYNREPKDDSSFISSILSKTRYPDKYLPALCDMFATRPARLLGIYPQKGTLEPGSDADIIIWDSAREFCSTKTEMLRGGISDLMLKGELLSSEGSNISKQGAGRYIYRTSIIQ